MWLGGSLKGSGGKKPDKAGFYVAHDVNKEGSKRRWWVISQTWKKKKVLFLLVKQLQTQYVEWA